MDEPEEQRRLAASLRAFQEFSAESEEPEGPRVERESSDLERVRRRVAEAERALAEAEQALRQARSLESGVGEGAFRNHGEAARARRTAAEADCARAQSELAQARAAVEQDPLVKLALHGQAKREAVERVEAAQKAAADKDNAEAARRRLLLSCSEWGFFGTWRGRVLDVLIIAFGLQQALSWGLRAAGHLYGADGTGTSMLAMLVGFAAAVLLQIPLERAVLRACARALARERDWLKGMPFPVFGYEELLGRDRYDKHIKVTATFAHPLSAEQVALVRDAAIGLVKSLASESNVSFPQDRIVLSFSRPHEDDQSNAPWRSLLRRTVAEFLLPLHARFGLASIQIST